MHSLGPEIDPSYGNLTVKRLSNVTAGYYKSIGGDQGFELLSAKGAPENLLTSPHGIAYPTLTLPFFGYNQKPSERAQNSGKFSNNPV